MMSRSTLTRGAALIALLGSAALVCAAADSEPEHVDEPQEAQSAAENADVEQLRREWAEALEALQRYSAAQRDQALARAAQSLASMDERLEQIESRTKEEWAQLSEQARRQREAALRQLRRERNELAEWYGAMRHSSANAWDDVKRGFIAAYETLGESFREASDEFNDARKRGGIGAE